MTYARNQCRKNSFHTDHVTIGQYTHKVINMQHINKTQDRCTQRHETIGCEQMYNDFQRQGVSVRNKENVSGAKKNIGRTWHPELADKGSRIRNHMYYAIDNCGGDPLVLRSIIDKFQNNHTIAIGLLLPSA